MPGTRTRPASPRPTTTTGPAPTDAAGIVIDPYRDFVFPNRIRELRRERGSARLLALSHSLPDIPYIRLSKIERGTVFARADELGQIAAALEAAPGDLLIDVDDPAFDMSAWAAPFLDDRPADIAEERLAIMLAAALRARRESDRSLTVARLDREFGLPPVIVSRLENAHKALDRWNGATLAAVCRLFAVPDPPALRRQVVALLEGGALADHITDIATPERRLARTRERILGLAAELAAPEPPRAPARATDRHGGEPRLVPVRGAPLPDGLLAATPTDAMVEAPRAAGPRAFGLRVCRPTLGGGLPGSATVIVDPDRFPTAGGLAAVREGDAYRLVTVTIDRAGVMTGYSVLPDREVIIDERDPADVAAVIAAVFV